MRTQERDAAGNLYGTTFQGGNAGCFNSGGYGTVFKVTPGTGGWTESTLYNFSGKDGANPYTTVTLDKSTGALYGVTFYGGAYACNGYGGYGCGVAFELTPTASGPWTKTILHNFTGGNDGAEPRGQLLLVGGMLLGTTQKTA